jgi:hypothetical protein
MCYPIFLKKRAIINDVAQTEEQKQNRDHFGDMTEAHQDQKSQTSEELGDKIEGIKAEYPGQAARRTQQHQLDAIEREADKALEGLKEQKDEKNNEQENESEDDS